MNPYEHGEVFVLDDGGEVDMDFGHYERFLGVTCKSKWNLTMGKVFDMVRQKERRGDYLGRPSSISPMSRIRLKTTSSMSPVKNRRTSLLLK